MVMDLSRRALLKMAAWGVLATAVGPGLSRAQGPGTGDIEPNDRVFIANEDSNTLSVIDPRGNRVETTINLTSFDEDPRPPFRLVTGGIMPTFPAMVGKPLYHGCILAHGAVPSPDGRLLATSGRGSSNVYLIDTLKKKVVGNTPNPQAGAQTNPERLSSGIVVGREPHEPTFTRNGKELWVAVRGEDRLAILDVELAIQQSRGMESKAVMQYVPTLNGPAQVWFSRDGQLAFVISQKVAKVEVFRVNPQATGYSRPTSLITLDISAQDKPAFTPFLKTTPEGGEAWLSHKLADQVSCLETREPFRTLDVVPLGNLARPNHLEFVENPKGKAIYVSLARVDDAGPGGVASSQIAVIDHTAPAGARKVVGTFFTHGREAHGLWTNPANNLLYVAHEQDELPQTPNAGQTVCSAFDVSNPLAPVFMAQIPLGFLDLPSGQLRNKKSINLVYVRPGHKGQTA
jgi:YVTN family beta-propeller protein